MGLDANLAHVFLWLFKALPPKLPPGGEIRTVWGINTNLLKKSRLRQAYEVSKYKKAAFSSARYLNSR